MCQSLLTHPRLYIICYCLILNKTISFTHAVDNRNEILRYNEQNALFESYYTLDNQKADISCFHIQQGKLYIGTMNHGVYCLTMDTHTLTHPIAQGNIPSIYGDKEGDLWIGSWEEGLYRQERNGELTNYRHAPHTPSSLSSNFVRACCEDNFGNLWIGTADGLDCYNRMTGLFSHHSEYEFGGNGLTHSSVWDIVRDAQGTLWVGTYFGGVNLIVEDNDSIREMLSQLFAPFYHVVTACDGQEDNRQPQADPQMLATNPLDKELLDRAISIIEATPHAEAIDWIIQEMEECLTLVDDSKYDLSPSHVKKTTVEGILARVCLWRAGAVAGGGKAFYEKADNYAKAVYNSNKHKLNPRRLCPLEEHGQRQL